VSHQEVLPLSAKIRTEALASPARGLIRIELVGTPVAKGRPKFTKTGHAYTPGKTRNYETVLKVMAGKAMRGRAPLQGPVRIWLEAHLPIPSSWSKKNQKWALNGELLPITRPDLDNLFKGAADALNGIVWRDDRQIVEARLIKVYSDRPRLVLIVTEA
jgi:Holliday junction resolvase RusA-like endonuclease